MGLHKQRFRWFFLKVFFGSSKGLLFFSLSKEFLKFFLRLTLVEDIHIQKQRKR